MTHTITIRKLDRKEAAKMGVAPGFCWVSIGPDSGVAAYGFASAKAAAESLARVAT